MNPHSTTITTAAATTTTQVGSPTAFADASVEAMACKAADAEGGGGMYIPAGPPAHPPLSCHAPLRTLPLSARGCTKRSASSDGTPFLLLRTMPPVHLTGPLCVFSLARARSCVCVCVCVCRVYVYMCVCVCVCVCARARVCAFAHMWPPPRQGALWGAVDLQKMDQSGSLKKLTITMKKSPSSFKLFGSLVEINEAAKSVVDKETVIYEGERVHAVCRRSLEPVCLWGTV